MAVSPLNVATKGYLDSPLAVGVSGYLGGLIPSIPEAIHGGVVVIAQTYGTLSATITTGFEQVESALAVQVLSNTPGIAMVAKAVSAIIMATKAAVLQVSQSLGYQIGPEPGAEVSDKEPGTDE